MNRRDFLQPRHFAQTAGQMLGALDELAEPAAPPSSADAVLLHLKRRAMATHFEIVLPFGTPDAVEMSEAAFRLLDALEEQMTVYRETSEVSRLNRRACAAPVRVDPRLFGLLELAARIHRETEGAYDITAGALIKAWGFFRGPRRVPTEAERTAARERVGMSWVTLDADGRTVRYARPGLEINLGSIGKGYALDRMARFLGDGWGVGGMLLHGGTSSVYARGCPPDEERGWQVGILHPWDRQRRLARVWLRDRALGNSAATHQHLEYNGQKLGHILDPRTGWPASEVAHASVVAASAAESDALSTAFYVGGVELARRYCDAHPGVGSILLPKGEGAEPVVLGLAPHEFALS
ncbi:MAG TPA: FAD:protein FMN transferase [Gemmataceae bacterium]|jgi:thiamine biosynthesis lipoprotein